MVTIKDVATLAGVSVSTVSIILNGKGKDRKISAETHDKVLQAAKELNYKPNLSAKKLRHGAQKEYSIAIYWASDYRANSLAQIVLALQEELVHYDYPIHISVCPYRNGQLHLEKSLLTGAFDAAIIGNMSDEDMKYIHQNPPSIPIVLFNRPSEIYSTVTIDNQKAGEAVATYFLEKSFDSIGMVMAKVPYSAMNTRNKSFASTCKKYGLPIKKEYVFFVKESSIESGVKAGKELCNQQILPRALFCDSDALAQGLLYSLHKCNIRVPEDIAIVAVAIGNPEANKYSVPALSTLDIPIAGMAASCLQLLIKVLEHQLEPPHHVRFESPLQIREST